MKILTILAAALAAGLTTFAANALEEGSRQVSMVSARPELSGIERSAGKDEASPKRGLTREEAFHAARAEKKDVAAGGKQKDDVAPVAETKQKDDVVTVAAKPEDRYKPIIEKYAMQNGIPIDLAHAVITVESNYKPYSLGRAGEVGLMQIKPATAKLMGYDGSATGLFDPETNIKFGMKYLGKARKLGDGTTCGTILKYNAGHAAKRMNPTSRDYCEKVKRHILESIGWVTPDREYESGA
ncbi:transglycosylase SLT domain-containing protein [Mesorhizobium sp. KR9-304]|uniref:lytic transglycosylase domain-containing protein n=1 Tax=Mesorhizobium sp. KR9-304 TaxID=3156614 RepID=UPI0032B52033